MDAFFQAVTQKDATTAKGPVALPILYTDASLLGTFFFAELGRARELLEGRSIEPWPVFGRALVALFAWEYRASTVGRYNEVGLGIQARKRGSKPSLLKLGLDMRKQTDQGIWVVSLPVTTEEAYAAGVELWGYPKYVAPIETRFDAGGARARLADELELSVGELGGPRTPGLPTVTYTSREGSLIRTVIETDHRVRWGSGRSARLELQGDGPTSRAMRALGLEGARPTVAFRTDGFRAILPAGVDCGAA